MEKVNRRVVKRWGERAQDLSELGAVWNGFSLVEKGELGLAVEKVGQAVDQEYLATAALVSPSRTQLDSQYLLGNDNTSKEGELCADDDLAASMGTIRHGTPTHLLSILLAYQTTSFLPTSETRPIRASPRYPRKPERQA